MGNNLRPGCKGCCRPRPPTLLRKYNMRENEMLGSGTFAIVYRASDKKNKMEVAVKIIDKANSRRDLLNTEIWILQNFGNHPNIVNLYDMYETADSVQLVLELMQGGELFDMLDENGPYDEADAAKYLRSIAAGLAYLHSGKVAHRDLKPENLLLTSKGPEGILKISDFGLAKILIDDELMKVACGTWIYCAPEVLILKFSKTGEYNKLCDVFSVGCILFIMLGGYHPFDLDGTDDEKAMQDCIMSDTWDFEDPAWDNVSNEAKDIMESMLKWDPAERITADQVLSHRWTSGRSTSGKLLTGTPDEIIDSDMKKPRQITPKVQVEEAAPSPPLSPKRVAAAGENEQPDRLEQLKDSIVSEPIKGAHAPLPVSRQRASSLRSTEYPKPDRKARGSLDSQGRRNMPRKHMPRAGTHVEEVKSRHAPLGLDPQGVGTTFNAKANENRWDKYYVQNPKEVEFSAANIKSVADEKSNSTAAPEDGDSVPTFDTNVAAQLTRKIKSVITVMEPDGTRSIAVSKEATGQDVSQPVSPKNKVQAAESPRLLLPFAGSPSIATASLPPDIFATASLPAPSAALKVPEFEASTKKAALIPAGDQGAGEKSPEAEGDTLDKSRSLAAGKSKARRPKAKAKAAVATEAVGTVPVKFNTVAEWKAKQAPKLLKANTTEDLSSTSPEAKLTKSRRSNGSSKAKGKKAGGVRPTKEDAGAAPKGDAGGAPKGDAGAAPKGAP